MSRSHLLPHRTRPAPQPPPGAADAGPDAPGQPPPGSRVFLVQRTGALVVGVFLLVFGLVGLAGGLDFVSTQGEPVLGLSSNGLLSVLSVVVGAVLLGADLLGPRVASTVMVVVGSLFLLSALVNLALLRSSFNLLAFEMSNVLFSVVVGLLLLGCGAYGRVSGNLPPDSPYARPRPAGDTEEPESYPATPEEFAAEAAMRAAEIAVCEHTATDDQRRRVQAMAAVHTRAERRQVWRSFDDRPAAPAAPGREPAVGWAGRAAGLLPGLAPGRRRGTGRPHGG